MIIWLIGKISEATKIVIPTNLSRDDMNTYHVLLKKITIVKLQIANKICINIEGDNNRDGK